MERVTLPRRAINSLVGPQTTKRLAWSLMAGSVVIVLIGLALGILGVIASRGERTLFSHVFYIPVSAVSFSVVGALVASRHPRHPLGWLYLVVAVCSSAMMLSIGFELFDQYGLVDSSLPGAAFVHWVGTWTFVSASALPVTIVLLLFPDGKLPSRRWRPIAWAAIIGITLATFSIAFHPGPLEDYGIVGGESLWHWGLWEHPDRYA